MRSRYTAYTRADVDYLARTLAPECRATFDRRAAKRWATDSEWLGLRIVATENGQAWDDAGVVEFVATFRKKGKVLEHRERSRFRKSGLGEWFFVEGAPVSRA